MIKKIGSIKVLIRLLKENIFKEKDIKLKNYVTSDYDEYLQKTQDYHDKIIKRMYNTTKHAHETPTRLREILREQINYQEHRRKKY